MRPWIATVAAYALVLQVALSGMLASRLIAADDVSFDGQFSICHGGGKPDSGEQGGSGKPHQDQTLCALCVLASGPPAILTPGYASTVVAAVTVADVDPRTDDRIREYHSPTGQYQ